MKDFQFIRDTEIEELARKEADRQANGLEMIPSENHTSRAVLDVLGSRLTDKYSEGYPGGRYYGGCEFVDEVEKLAIARAKRLFGVDHANVQAYSGSPANQAAYFALLEPGDTVLGLHLFYGGHMTHGLKVNFSGTLYNSVQYQTDKSGFIDYDEVTKLAREHKPKLIVGGYTAYPRKVDWQKLREIADEVGAFLLADISHISALVISGDHPSPVGIADVIMTTTHKGLRGPRGALLLANGNPSTPLKKVDKTKQNIPTLLDRAIIPGLQGGPHNHQTAAIAVALNQALQPEFKEYGAQVARNAKVLADELMSRGFELVTGGTETHLMVVDMNSKKLSGKEAEKALGLAGITVNKNTIPFDPRSPFDPSGIRLGTPALTTRGMVERDMVQIAAWISDAVDHAEDESYLKDLHSKITNFTKDYPLPE